MPPAIVDAFPIKYKYGLKVGTEGLMQVSPCRKEQSIKDLATHLGKTEFTVSRWCTNKVQSTVETRYELSKFLKAGMSYWFQLQCDQQCPMI